MDINLDEPLRDDERLFAPKPYARAEQPITLPSTSKPFSEHERPKNLETAVNGKTVKKKKKKEKDAAMAVDEKKPKTKKKSVKKTKKPINEDQHDAYTALNSSPIENENGKPDDGSLIGLTDSLLTDYHTVYKELAENDRIRLVNGR